MMTTAPIIVSYSELDTFRQCPLKHHLAYGLRYTKPSKEGSALDKGGRYHLVMEEHYRLVKAYQDAHKGKNPKEGSAEYDDLLAMCKAEIHKMLWDPRAGAFFDDVAALIWWMYEGHIGNYGLMDEWQIMAIEHHIITPLRDQNGRKSRYHLKAKLDLIIRDRSNFGLWVVDHKSGGNLPTQMDLEIDDQFGLYTWLMRQMGKKVLGSLHAANRTTRNKGDFPDAEARYKPQTFEQRMALTYLNRSDKEVENIALDAYYVARAAYPPKSKERSLYSAPDPRSCGWKCDFKEPHLLMRKGRKPAEVMMEYGFKIDRTRH